jgi:adenylate cyclase
VLSGIYVILTFSNYIRESLEKRQVRHAFGQYLSPALVEQLAQNPDQLKLGGETKVMTFLFCDVRGFTAISELFKGNPQGLTVLMNRLLTPLTDVILTSRGTIDKYMGDCIMAFWNAPLDVPQHPAYACEAALGMFKALEVLNGERRAEAEATGSKYLPLNIGIGVNTGECVVGNMGSQQRFDYSVLGDPVNLASRLEGQSKNYGVGVVIGEDTAAVVGDRFALIELDLIAVKGKKEAVRIFTVLGDSNRRATPAFTTLAEAHAAMLAAFRAQQWDAAAAASVQCRSLSAGEFDGLYDLYDERITAFRETPPGDDWDGVYRATSK